MPFKVTDFGTNLKPASNFLGVNNSNLLPISYRGYTINRIMWITGQIFAVDRGCLCLTHSFAVKHKIQDCKIWPQETRNITVLWFEMYFDILNCLGVDHEHERQTDRHYCSK